MILYCISHNYDYELEKLLSLFFPLEKTQILKVFEKKDENYLYTEKVNSENEITLISELSYDGKILKGKKKISADSENDAERSISVLSFTQLTQLCGFTPQWGILTGVRPSKLMMRYIDEYGEEQALRRFNENLLVSPEKAELARDVAKAEKSIIAKSGEKSFSLYISIPFCPTRCSYCSFVSHSIASPSAKKLIPEYVEKLCSEIRLTGEKVKENGLVLKSVYWGGGTPTTLSAEQLDLILTEIENSFDLKTCLEYTVEAGRPDTVTDEKLKVLKKHGVSRISINPQTFSNSVLKNIGRCHTVEDTVEKYKKAKQLGFDSINTDLIAGLPGDSLEGFKKSIDSAIELEPENITVHTLALKRSSTIVTESESGNLDKNVTSHMIEYASAELKKAGYKPYYMYRQSRSLGNLENVGWCKEGKECFYNVFMMEECHSIMSAGAGAVTKLVSPDCTYIERIFNYKYPFEYISRFNVITERKNRISDFFSEYK